jgi:hypothetical protein
MNMYEIIQSLSKYLSNTYRTAKLIFKVGTVVVVAGCIDDTSYMKNFKMDPLIRDVNGDGVNDIVFLSYERGTDTPYTLKMTDGKTGETKVIKNLPRGLRELLVEDFTGNKALDIQITYYSEGPIPFSDQSAVALIGLPVKTTGKCITEILQGDGKGNFSDGKQIKTAPCEGVRGIYGPAD